MATKVVILINILVTLMLTQMVLSAPQRQMKTLLKEEDENNELEAAHNFWNLKYNTPEDEGPEPEDNDSDSDSDQEMEGETNWNYDDGFYGEDLDFDPTDESSLKGRNFIVVVKLPSGKEIEVPFQFQNRKMRQQPKRRRQAPSELATTTDPSASSISNTSTGNNTNTTTTTTTVATTHITQAPPTDKQIAPDKVVVNTGGGPRPPVVDINQFTNVSGDIKSLTIYIHYTHQLTVLERAGDSDAKIGSPCAPKPIIENDYCERAAYPNKNKMFCVTMNSTGNGNFTKNTCACKFYRKASNALIWEQMRQGVLVINGVRINACLVPKFGVCNHRISTGVKNKSNKPVYEIDVCQGHFQCDNSQFVYNITTIPNGLSVPLLQLNKHCSDNEFLDSFHSSVRDQVLICSKPNPRRFSEYDEFKYYCLPKLSRDFEGKHFRPVNVDMLQNQNEDKP